MADKVLTNLKKIAILSIILQFLSISTIFITGNSLFNALLSLTSITIMIVYSNINLLFIKKFKYSNISKSMKITNNTYFLYSIFLIIFFNKLSLLEPMIPAHALSVFWFYIFIKTGIILTLDEKK